MTNPELTKYIDDSIEAYLRDKDHKERIARGLIPWPNTDEQNLIDRFDIFNDEREQDQW